MKTATATAVATEAAIKRLISAILIFALCLGLCACGQKSEEPQPTPSPTPTATPEYLYASKFADIKDVDYPLRPVCYTENGFYAVGTECTGEDIPEDVIREAEKEGEEPVNDGRWNTYATRLFFVEYNGNSIPLDRYTELPEAVNGENWKKFSSVSSFGSLCIDEDGNIRTLEYNYKSGSSAPENAEDWIDGEDYNEFETVWLLRELRGDGKELSKREIKLPEGSSLQPQALVPFDGNLLVLTDKGLGIVSTKGEFLEEAQLPDTPSWLSRLGSGEICAVAGGKVYAFDGESHSFREMATVPDGVMSVSPGNGEYDFFYNAGTNFYGFSSKTGVAKELFNWTGVNVNSARIVSDVLVAENGSCTFVTGDNRIGTVTREAYNPELEKTVLKLSTLNPSYALIDAVSEFNRRQADVRIDIEDYSAYTGGETGDRAFRYYVDNHLGGKLPDIIDMASLPYLQMAASGDLTDLYPFIDADREIRRADFFSNVLVALELDGGLYCTCGGFEINTVLGASRVVGDNAGWDYAKYYNALNGMREGCDGFDSTVTQSEMLSTLLAMDLDEFIDWDALTCDFTSGAFGDMLDFISTFREYFDYEHAGWSENDYTDMRIRNGYQMLMPMTIYGFEDLMHAGYEFGEDVTFIGYPTDFGTGNTLTVVSLADGGNLAMSSQCNDKQAAWEFLRTFFTEDYQRTLDYFPSNVNVFNEKLAEAMVQTPVTNKKGDQLYDEDGEPRFYAKGTMYLSDFTAVPYFPLSDVQAAKLKNLIDTTVKIQEYNEDVERTVKAAMQQEDPVNAVQAAVTDYLNMKKLSE